MCLMCCRRGWSPLKVCVHICQSQCGPAGGRARLSTGVGPGPRASAPWGCPGPLGPSQWPQRETWSSLPRSPGERTDTHRWLITRRSASFCVVRRGSGDSPRQTPFGVLTTLRFGSQMNTLTGLRLWRGAALAGSPRNESCKCFSRLLKKIKCWRFSPGGRFLCSQVQIQLLTFMHCIHIWRLGEKCRRLTRRAGPDRPSGCRLF